MFAFVFVFCFGFNRQTLGLSEDGKGIKKGRCLRLGLNNLAKFAIITRQESQSVFCKEANQ